MSSDEIAQRVARTSEFLKQADTNHNGMIDPDEAGDPQAKFMLDRIFSRMGKEPHYPMAISEILQGYEAYYRTRGTPVAATQVQVAPRRAGRRPRRGWLRRRAWVLGRRQLPPRECRDDFPPAGGNHVAFRGPGIPCGGVSRRWAIDGIPSVGGGPDARHHFAGRRIAGNAIACRGVFFCRCQAGAAKAGPFSHGPRAIAQRAARLVPGKGRQRRRADHHGGVHRQLDAGEAGGVCERYDLNHDGIITAAECLKVEKAKASGK